MKMRRVMDRRLSKMSEGLRRLHHRVAWGQLNGSLIKTSAGWTTYGTFSEESFMSFATTPSNNENPPWVRAPRRRVPRDFTRRRLMATPQDADLIIKLYDLRRDETMRKARNFFISEFFPQSADDVKALFINREEHP